MQGTGRGSPWRPASGDVAVSVGTLGPEPPGRPSSSGGAPAPVPATLMKVRAEWIDFYDAQFHRVVRFVMRTGASQDAARDAAQEAFLESWKLLDRNPGGWQEILHKEAWIRKVALLRYGRPPGRRRRPLIADGEIPDRSGPGPGHDELTVQAQSVLDALRTLDQESRSVIAYDMDGIPADVIAREMGISSQRVRDIRKKARAALKRWLASERESREGSHEKR